MDYNQFNFPSRRSNTLARHGMVAASQPLAAQAGLDILKAGGNAIDAAIATAATLCVVEPCSTGIGGDAFALIWWQPDKKLYGINASGPAPAELTARWIRDKGHELMPERGALPVTVPGSLRGWQTAIERFGTMDLKRLLTSATAYAREGFPVSQLIAGAWERSTSILRQHPDSRRCWLPGNRAPHTGELFRNPDFGRTLETLALDGPDAFYQGEIARQIVETVQAAGGLLSLDDMSTFQAQWVEPISITYRSGYRFHEIPPNGQGLAALLALNLVKGFEPDDLVYGSAGYWHILIEAMKLSFADAAAFIADPDLVEVPIQGLLDDKYTHNRRKLIDPEKALLPSAGQPSRNGDTVYFTVADEEGNMVSWIQSLYMGFGSGLTAGTTGIQLHNRGANFVLDDGHPNQVAPGKRPYHTIIPGFITREGQPWCSFGVMGGFMQPQGHLQVGLNLVDIAMDPQSALDAPRFNWLQGRRVVLEPSVPEDVRAGLVKRGHDLVPRAESGRYQFGGGQVIIRDPEGGTLIGGSDPRKDGVAVGW